jgi:hypothetical protein
MGVGVAQVLLPAYVRVSSRRHGRRRRSSFLGEERNRWERCSSGRVAKASSDGYEAFVSAIIGKGLPFSWVPRGCYCHLTSRIYGMDNTELDKGQSVRARWCERCCGKRWQGSVTVFCGHGTEKDGGPTI